MSYIVYTFYDVEIGMYSHATVMELHDKVGRGDSGSVIIITETRTTESSCVAGSAGGGRD